MQEYLTTIDPEKAIDMDKQPWKAARPRYAPPPVWHAVGTEQTVDAPPGVDAA